jgi:putative membrane protein
MKQKLLLAVSMLALALQATPSAAQSPAELNDLQIAHVAYVADNIDIRYAHLALAISSNPAIHEFARTMIRDHTAVNEQALALLKKLEAQPQDNFLSKQLVANSEKLVDEMSQLRGAAFDKRYAENELAYHKAVNDLVGNTFIPNIDNAEVKTLFEAGLKIFKAHEHHAEMMVKAVSK